MGGDVDSGTRGGGGVAMLCLAPLYGGLVALYLVISPLIHTNKSKTHVLEVVYLGCTGFG